MKKIIGLAALLIIVAAILILIDIPSSPQQPNTPPENLQTSPAPEKSEAAKAPEKSQTSQAPEKSQASQVPEKSQALPVQSTNSKLSFGVMGDIHTDAAALKRALTDYKKINPNMDVLVINGDTVEQGLDKEYAVITGSLEENKKLLPKIVIKNIGNHEFFDYARGKASIPEMENHISKYLDFSGEEKVYHDKWVKGYHFISLGSEKTNTSDMSNTQAFFSKEQFDWLESKLAEDYKPGRPIIVTLHQPFSSTRPSGELQGILAKYPEVILFSSHTHTYLENNNIAYQAKPFLAVHTGATHRPIRWRSSPGGRGSTEIPGSQGLYVEIDNGKVTIRGRDFMKGDWVKDAAYIKGF